MIDITTERLIPIEKAGEELPHRPHRSTIWRWACQGLNGLVLETIRLGGRRFTSQQALKRFLERLNAGQA